MHVYIEPHTHMCICTCMCWPTCKCAHICAGGFPGGANTKGSACNAGRFNPWIGKIPWRRKRQPTPVFLPGESHGQRSLAGYSPRSQSRTRLSDFAFTFFGCLKHSSQRDGSQRVTAPDSSQGPNGCVSHHSLRRDSARVPAPPVWNMADTAPVEPAQG